MEQISGPVLGRTHSFSFPTTLVLAVLLIGCEQKSRLLPGVGQQLPVEEIPTDNATPTPTPSSTTSPLTPTSPRTSIQSHNGITWDFAAPVQAGQFINGDWFVIGPVTITSISPSDSNPGDLVDLNGTTLNPRGNNPNFCPNSFDSRLSGYNRSSNFAHTLLTQGPQTVQPGTSVVSVASHASPVGQGQALRFAAVLTVLATAPLNQSFRPPYWGTNKTIRFNRSHLTQQRLANLSLVGTPPALSLVTSDFRAVRLDCGHWNRFYGFPTEHGQSVYYRDWTTQFGAAALLLNSDLPGTNDSTQKDELLVYLAQLGIDQMAILPDAFASCTANGFCNGYKAPVIFAGAVLQGAQDFLNVGVQNPTVFVGPGSNQNIEKFSEDAQFFVVQQTSPGVINWGFPSATVNPPYTSIHVGLPEWSNNHANRGSAFSGNFGIYTDTPSWDEATYNPSYPDTRSVQYRRSGSANGMLGYALAFHAMGLEASWNHPPFFNYLDRYVHKLQLMSLPFWDNWYYSFDEHSTFRYPPFIRQMWLQHRPNVGTPVWIPPAACSASQLDAC